MLPRSEHSPRIALVTGAGRGLGRALSLELASRGLQVAALGRRMADLEALKSAAPAGRILPVVADVADPASVEAAFAKIETELGTVDTLICSAAVYPHRDFLEETPESFMETLSINLGGMAFCAMRALQPMVACGHGRIVTVTSFADARPEPTAAAYSISKGAGRILTRALVADLADRFPEIVINEWIPGALQTGMGIPDGHAPEKAARWGATLALWHDPKINGATFVEDREHLSVLSLKRRIFNRLTGRRVVPRSLSETQAGDPASHA